MAIGNGSHKESNGKAAAARVAAFCVIVVAWIALDQLTKSLFAGMTPAGILAGPFAGIIDIRLVHNTGAAWGVFADNTFALGVFSLVVCIVITAFFIVTRKNATWVQTVSFALIVAGGIGNAIDRFAQGYVIDFIEFSFMDFPVFNVADIGVTCGFALLVISLLVEMKRNAEGARA